MAWELFSCSKLIQFQKSEGLTKGDIYVRLQWDPDHKPNYDKETRKAIQLGLKGKVGLRIKLHKYFFRINIFIIFYHLKLFLKILKKYAEEWILSINDITDFVKTQHNILQTKGENELITSRERLYVPQHPKAAEQIGLDDSPA